LRSSCARLALEVVRIPPLCPSRYDPSAPLVLRPFDPYIRPVYTTLLYDPSVLPTQKKEDDVDINIDVAADDVDAPAPSVGMQAVGAAEDGTAAVDSAADMAAQAADAAASAEASAKLNGVGVPDGMSEGAGKVGEVAGGLEHMSEAGVLFNKAVATLFAPVAGPQYMWIGYFTLVLFSLIWFFYGFGTLSSQFFNTKVSTIETTYHETIPYPDIYWCLPANGAQLVFYEESKRAVPESVFRIETMRESFSTGSPNNADKTKVRLTFFLPSPEL